MSNAAPADVFVFAKDPQRVAKFYEELLGLPAVHAERDHVVLASARNELVIHAIAQWIADTITISVPPERRIETPIKLWFFPRQHRRGSGTCAELLGNRCRRRFLCAS